MKVVLITLVPLMAMFLFAGILTYIVTDEAQSAQQVQQLARLGSQSSTLVHELQMERAAAAAFNADPGDNATHPTLRNYQRQIVLTDREMNEFLDQAERLDGATRQPITKELGNVEGRAESMTKFREGIIDQSRKNPDTFSIQQTTIQYREMIGDLLTINERLASATTDSSLADQIRAASAFSRMKEWLAEEQITLLQVLADKENDGRRFNSTTYQAFLNTMAHQQAFEGQFLSSATSQQQALAAAALTNKALSDSRRMETEARNAGVANPLSTSDSQWMSTMTERLQLVRQVESGFNNSIVAAAGVFRDNAIRQTIIVITVALAALVIALLVSLAVARSMVRPLVRLRSSALEVAYQSLPEVVRKLQDADQNTAATAAAAETKARSLDIRSGDEIGQVAQAFNAVHLEAVRVASEQAQLRRSVSTMFVNLSRRSQLLVDRLIRLIDGLEQGERDPDRLAELFKLDHLATRMRRNDENLLVLAGADAGRRWTRPAPLVDVLRAATAEVEQYTRVKLGSVDDTVEISAAAVNDLVHLVAELLENATSFSSPRTDVVVDSRRVGDHVVIEIEDQGIGMSRDQLAEFNERLAKPPVFDIAVSRMMGLFVVGRLASRHGVKVMLRDASGGGVLAIVTLPASVLHGARQSTPALPAGSSAEAEDARPVERIPSERIDQAPDGSPLPPGAAPAMAGAPIDADFHEDPFSTRSEDTGGFNTHRPEDTGAFGVRHPEDTGGFNTHRPEDTGGFGVRPPSGVDASREAPTGGMPAGRPESLFDDHDADGPVAPPAPARPLGPSPWEVPTEHAPFAPPTRGSRPDDTGAQPTPRFVPPPMTLGPETGPQPAAARSESPGGWDHPEREHTGANPFVSPTSGERSAPLDHTYTDPTREVPVVDESTGGPRLLDDLRPEQPPSVREPDLTWSGQRPTPSGRPVDTARLVGPRPQPGSGGDRPGNFDEPTTVFRRPESLPELGLPPVGPPPSTPSEPPTSTPAASPAPPVSAAPAAASTPTAPSPPPTPTPTSAAPLTGSPAPSERPVRESAADAMARLRSEAANERSSTTGAQQIFRPGPSDPPSSDPTIEMPLPIFEAIESEWFRARTAPSPRSGNGHGAWSPPRVPEAPGARQVGGQPADESDDKPPRVPEAAGASRPGARPEGDPTDAETTDATQAPETAADADGEHGPETREPVLAGSVPQQPPAEASTKWESPADVGWRAAQAAAEPTVAGTTKSGLPKRVPMAHFVPGRVDVAAKTRPAKPANHRTPEAVRGVLSSYRSGLEQGRQAGRPARSGTTTFAGSSEEQEEM